MMTAVDTNVLLDVFSEPTDYSEASAAALRAAYDRGGICICPIVYAEVAVYFEERETLDAAMRTLGIVIIPDDVDAAWQAGRYWAAYRGAGGEKRHILPDFFVAAHAMIEADALLTRDRGFYRKHFAALSVIEPSED